MKSSLAQAGVETNHEELSAKAALHRIQIDALQFLILLNPHASVENLQLREADAYQLWIVRNQNGPCFLSPHLPSECSCLEPDISAAISFPDPCGAVSNPPQGCQVEVGQGEIVSDQHSTTLTSSHVFQQRQRHSHQVGIPEE